MDKLNFSIPKRKPVKWKDNLRVVELSSRDAIEVLNNADHQAIDQSYKDDWVPDKVSLVENSTLETEFREKKKEMKENGRNSRELAEHYGFLYVKDQFLVSKMVREGLKSKKSALNPLGDNEFGVYICKHPDVQLKIPMGKNEENPFIIVFKIILGRCKAVQPQVNIFGEPAPHYDSCSSSITANANDVPGALFPRTQIYLYEYSDDVLPLNRPRHCLPYAVIGYTKNTQSKLKTSSAVISSLSPAVPASMSRRMSDQGQGHAFKPGTYGARNQALKRNSFDRLPCSSPPMVPNTGINFINNITRPPIQPLIPDGSLLSKTSPQVFPNVDFNMLNNIVRPQQQQLLPGDSMKPMTNDTNVPVSSYQYPVNKDPRSRPQNQLVTQQHGFPVSVNFNQQATTQSSRIIDKPLHPFMRKKKKTVTNLSVIPIRPAPMRKNNLVIEKLDFPVPEKPVPSIEEPITTTLKSPQVDVTPSPETKTPEAKNNMEEMMKTVNKLFGKVPISNEEPDTDISDDQTDMDDDFNSISGPHTGYDNSNSQPKPKPIQLVESPKQSYPAKTIENTETRRDSFEKTISPQKTLDQPSLKTFDAKLSPLKVFDKAVSMLKFDSSVSTRLIFDIPASPLKSLDNPLSNWKSFENPESTSLSFDNTISTSKFMSFEEPVYTYQSFENTSSTYKSLDNPISTYPSSAITTHTSLDAQAAIFNNPVTTSTSFNNTVSAHQTFDNQGSTFKTFEYQGMAHKSFDSQGSTYKPFDNQESTYKSFDNQGSTYKSFDNQGSTFKTFDNQGSTFKTFNNQGSTSKSFDIQGSTHRSFDNQGSTFKTFDNQGSTSKSFDNQGSISNPFDNQESTHKSFDNQGSTSKTFDNQESTHKSFDNQRLTYKSFDNQESIHKSFDNQGSTFKTFDNQGSIHKSFDNQGSTFKTFDNQGLTHKSFDNQGLTYKSFDSQESTHKSFDNQGSAYKSFDNHGSTSKTFDNHGSTYKSFDYQGSTHKPFDNQGSTHKSLHNQDSIYKSSDDQGLTHKSLHNQGSIYKSSDDQGSIYKSSDDQGSKSIENKEPKDASYVQGLAAQLQSLGDIKDVLSMFNLTGGSSNDSSQSLRSSQLTSPMGSGYQNRDNQNTICTPHRYGSSNFGRHQDGYYSDSSRKDNRNNVESAYPCTSTYNYGHQQYPNNYANIQNTWTTQSRKPSNVLVNCYGDIDYRKTRLPQQSPRRYSNLVSLDNLVGSGYNQSGSGESNSSFPNRTTSDQNISQRQDDSMDNGYGTQQNQTNLASDISVSSADSKLNEGHQSSDLRVQKNLAEGKIANTDDISNISSTMEDLLPRLILVDLVQVAHAFKSGCKMCKIERDRVASKISKKKTISMRTYLEYVGVKIPPKGTKLRHIPKSPSKSVVANIECDSSETAAEILITSEQIYEKDTKTIWDSISLETLISDNSLIDRKRPISDHPVEQSNIKRHKDSLNNLETSWTQSDAVFQTSDFLGESGNENNLRTWFRSHVDKIVDNGAESEEELPLMVIETDNEDCDLLNSSADTDKLEIDLEERTETTNNEVMNDLSTTKGLKIKGSDVSTSYLSADMDTTKTNSASEILKKVDTFLSIQEQDSVWVTKNIFDKDVDTSATSCFSDDMDSNKYVISPVKFQDTRKTPINELTQNNKDFETSSTSYSTIDMDTSQSESDQSKIIETRVASIDNITPIQCESDDNPSHFCRRESDRKPEDGVKRFVKGHKALEALSFAYSSTDLEASLSESDQPIHSDEKIAPVIINMADAPKIVKSDGNDTQLDKYSKEFVESTDKKFNDDSIKIYKVEDTFPTFPLQFARNKKEAVTMEIKVIQGCLKKFGDRYNRNSHHSPLKDDLSLKTALLEIESELIMELHHTDFVCRPNQRLPREILFDYEQNCVYATGDCFLYSTTFVTKPLYRSLQNIKKEILDAYKEKQSLSGPCGTLTYLNSRLNSLLNKRKLLLRTLTGSVKQSRLRQLEKSRKNFLLCLDHMNKTIKQFDKSQMKYLNNLFSELTQHTCVLRSELENHDRDYRK